MERWSGKVAVVTGASYGIGEAILKSLAKNGLIVIGLGRNLDKLNTISATTKGKTHVMKCDMKNERDILSVFRKIEEQFGGIDILINNAGFLDPSSMIDGSTNAWRNVLETNVLGLSICTREALKSMRIKNDHGHIIHINSLAGHRINNLLTENIGMYPASKYAVTALTQIHRNELRNSGSKIKITSISPGLVHTNMGSIAGSMIKADDYSGSEEVPEGFLSKEDVADAVVCVLSLQPHVEIVELMLQANTSVTISQCN